MLDRACPPLARPSEFRLLLNTLDAASGCLTVLTLAERGQGPKKLNVLNAWPLDRLDPSYGGLALRPSLRRPPLDGGARSDPTYTLWEETKSMEALQ